jgi:hypothetical protein
MSDAGTFWGAYGFRITGFEAGELHLTPVPADWPELRLEFERGPAPDPQPPGTVRGGEDWAELWLPGGDGVRLTRDPLTVTFATREPLSADAIIHPYLGLPAAIAAHWLGRGALHGGAFVHDERAWVVLGDREAGKSATLGELLSRGIRVLTDDVVVTEGADLFAGPRSVDLRGEVAGQIGGEPLGIVGNRARWRLRPAWGAARVRLGGLIVLEWGGPARMEALDAKARLQALVHSSVIPPGPEAGLGLLELAALPAWRFVRAARIDELGARTDQLLAELSQA